MIVFVPLSGLASVNKVPEEFDGIIYDSFRPLIGVSFCKRNSVSNVNKPNNSFRPLIGVSFCKHKSEAEVQKAIDKFSSPYRG